jgi:hypothetical protein
MKRMFLSVLLISLLVIPCVSNALDTKDDDLLLFFPCNEGKGNTVKDFSKHGNDGEIVGTVKWVDGKYEKALEFSEAGEVKAPHIPLNNKSFTVCLWTKPKLAGGSEQCVFTQTQVNAQNTSLHYRIYTNGTVRMGFYSNDLDAAAAVKANEWTHICFWLDIKAKSRRIYINGVKVAEDAGKAGIEYLGTAGDTMIGSWGSTGQKFNGLIDEVQVWDRALSEKDIKASMEDITIFAVDTSGKLATTWGSLKSERGSYYK